MENVVGVAKGDTIIENNGVFYGKSRGLPWFSSPVLMGVLNWPVLVNGITRYVNPKNVALVPWEYEWTIVKPSLFEVINRYQAEGKVKKAFMQKFGSFSDSWNTGTMGGGSGSVVWPKDDLVPVGKDRDLVKNPIIPRTDPKGSPNQQKRNGLVGSFVVLLLAAGALWFVLKKWK